MKIRVSTVELEGSCNYCEKGELSRSKKSLTYPYSEVIVLDGKKISSIFCYDCFQKITRVKIII